MFLRLQGFEFSLGVENCKIRIVLITIIFLIGFECLDFFALFWERYIAWFTQRDVWRLVLGYEVVLLKGLVWVLSPEYICMCGMQKAGRPLCEFQFVLFVSY